MQAVEVKALNPRLSPSLDVFLGGSDEVNAGRAEQCPSVAMFGLTQGLGAARDAGAPDPGPAAGEGRRARGRPARRRCPHSGGLLRLRPDRPRPRSGGSRSRRRRRAGALHPGALEAGHRLGRDHGCRGVAPPGHPGSLLCRAGTDAARSRASAWAAARVPRPNCPQGRHGEPSAPLRPRRTRRRHRRGRLRLRAPRLLGRSGCDPLGGHLGPGRTDASAPVDVTSGGPRGAALRIGDPRGTHERRHCRLVGAEHGRHRAGAPVPDERRLPRHPRRVHRRGQQRGRPQRRARGRARCTAPRGQGRRIQLLRLHADRGRSGLPARPRGPAGSGAERRQGAPAGLDQHQPGHQRART